MPRKQPTQADTLAAPEKGLYAPSEHWTHCQTPVDSTFGLYVPGSHSAQAASEVAPLEVPYFPAPQGWHKAGEREKVPKGHVDGVNAHDEAPCTLYVPGEQDAQVAPLALPVALLNVPAAHSVQEG